MTPELATAAGATLVAKDELFRQADVVTILAPCNNLHSKCTPDPCDLAADIAEPKDSQIFAVKIFADRALPAVVADGRIFLNNVAHTRENKSPGHLNRWR
jgi:hypothetical protein